MPADETDVDVDMHGQRRSRRIGALIAELAERQHGQISRDQLLAVGLGPGAIDDRLRRGALRLVHRGVYAVGHRAVTREARWMAAVLAGGEGAVLSHRSAAALWGLAPPAGGAIEVTVAGERRSRDDVVFRRGLPPGDEITVRNGIPATTVPRTLLDLAAVVSRERLARAVNQAEVLRLTDVLSVPDLLDRHPGRRGSAALREVLGTADATLTRSELEVRFLSFAERFGLPRPSANAAVEGLEVDCAWFDRRVAVELDGHGTHGTRLAFEQDRARDRILTAAGWRVVRVTWRQLHDAPATLAADLRRLVLG